MFFSGFVTFFFFNHKDLWLSCEVSCQRLECKGPCRHQWFSQTVLCGCLLPGERAPCPHEQGFGLPVEEPAASFADFLSAVWG